MRAFLQHRCHGKRLQSVAIVRRNLQLVVSVYPYLAETLGDPLQVNESRNDLSIGDQFRWPRIVDSIIAV